MLLSASTVFFGCQRSIVLMSESFKSLCCHCFCLTTWFSFKMLQLGCRKWWSIRSSVPEELWCFQSNTLAIFFGHQRSDLLLADCFKNECCHHDSVWKPSFQLRNSNLQKVMKQHKAGSRAALTFLNTLKMIFGHQRSILIAAATFKSTLSSWFCLKTQFSAKEQQHAEPVQQHKCGQEQLKLPSTSRIFFWHQSFSLWRCFLLLSSFTCCSCLLFAVCCLLFAVCCLLFALGWLSVTGGCAVLQHDRDNFLKSSRWPRPIIVASDRRGKTALIAVWSRYIDRCGQPRG